MDVNYLNEEVRKSAESLDAFFRALCRTEMSLDENILSKDEYARALAAKRRFRDLAPLAA